MTPDNLQPLLDKYRDGTLTDSERDELNRLTRRDEVFSAADRRASGILFRRTAGRVGLVMAALALLGAGVWMLRPRTAQGPLMADNTPATTLVPDTTPATPQERIYQGRREEEEGASKLLASSQLKSDKNAPKMASAAKKITTAPIPVVKTTQTVVHQEVESVVTCNNQCEADSVINDIWKFLSA